jgi:hypothetical protein
MVNSVCRRVGIVLEGNIMAAEHSNIFVAGCPGPHAARHKKEV